MLIFSKHKWDPEEDEDFDEGILDEVDESTEDED